MTAPTAQAVEKDLADLWKGGTGVGDPSGLQRIYTTNLVAYASDRPEGVRVEGILNELVAFQPGRYILIQPSASKGGPPLEYGVSGQCVFVAEKGKKVCCDLIQLTARGDVIENLYGFAFSLLVPDLPVEFWWPGDLPPSNVFFDRMAGLANRVWVDSSEFKSAAPAIARLAASWDARYPHTALADLNWVRVQRWRALIAEQFDGEWSGCLRDIDRVAIEYGEGVEPVRSFMLACWMAAQLGWEYRGPRLSGFPRSLEWMGPSGPVTVELTPVALTDVHPDRIRAVRIHTQGSKKGTFTVLRESDHRCVTVKSEVDGDPILSRAVTLVPRPVHKLLMEGLKHLAEDAVWKKTLAVAAKVLELPA